MHLKILSHILVRPENDQASEMEHWQLNELDSLSTYKKDYRMSNTLYDKCGAVLDVHKFLNETYCGSTAVEFKHVSNEEERLWCHETFEKISWEDVSD